MIKSFRDRETERIWFGEASRRFPRGIQNIALRKLRMLNQAKSRSDLMVPPGNRLEALKGRRRRQHSIRINDQWRICFVWRQGNAYNVEIVDYHGERRRG
jgi:proteic killer suppression protein